ncbi:MAG: hypothetical protein ACFFG0_17865 [Candidatus Thorarchaeota archaeon]
MAVLEIGIYLGMRSLVEIQYYSSSDNILNPNIRVRFLHGLEDFANEVFGDEINVISLSKYEIICYSEIIHLPNNKDHKPQALLTFAIIDKGTDQNFVKQHLQEILSLFLKNYTLNDIFTKTSKFFKKFKSIIDEILGDLRLNIDDRIKTVFKEYVK